MKIKLLVLLICLSGIVVYSYGQAPQSSAAQQPAFPAANDYAKANITSKIIPSEGSTWGYDIYVEGKRFIHQLSKPGLSGNSGFATKAQAQKVADLIIQKLKKGQMPPSVSVEERKQVRAL